MKSHVLELSYKCQSYSILQNQVLVFILHKCHYEQCKNLEANLPSFAATQPMLKSISLSRCKRGLNLPH